MANNTLSGPRALARAGLRTVSYRDTRGRTWDARVLGAGSTSGLKLALTSRRSQGVALSVVDNVPKATAIKSTNAYFNVR